MKVCIIQFSTLNASSYGILSTVKAVKTSGHEVTLLGSPDLKGIEEIWEHKRDLLLAALLRFRPDVIGFSVMTPFADYIESVASFIKYYFPKAVIVSGGNHVHAVREKVLEENPSIDYIYLGESETYFPKFLESLEKKDNLCMELPCIGSRLGGGYKINEMAVSEELEDILTYKAFDHIAPEFDVYTNNLFPSGLATVLLARGCPYECTYCAHMEEDIAQRKVKFVSPELFEKQLLDLKKQGVRSLLIHDAEFNLNKPWAYKIVDIMKKHKISLYWANARIDLVTEEFIKRLKELDIQEVSMPIESGSPRIRNKIFNRKVSNEQIYAAFEYAKKYNVLCSTNVIVAAPTERKEDLQMTKEMLLRIDADAPTLKTLVPLPGTILFEEYKGSIVWNRYSQFDLAHDTEDTLFKRDYPKCKFDMDIETFYEEFKLLDALIHPLCIILRRSFKLQGKSILLFATCELPEALEILRMFLVVEVARITVVLPCGMATEPFEKYNNVRIEKMPKELFSFGKTINGKNSYIPVLSKLCKGIENRSRAFHVLMESIRAICGYSSFLKSRSRVKKLVDSLEEEELSSKGHNLFFFVQKRNINAYRSMNYIGRKYGFKDAVGLNKEGLCFYQMIFGKVLKTKKTRYSRKMGRGKQRLYRKHIQS